MQNPHFHLIITFSHIQKLIILLSKFFPFLVYMIPYFPGFPCFSTHSSKVSFASPLCVISLSIEFTQYFDLSPNPNVSVNDLIRPHHLKYHFQANICRNIYTSSPNLSSDLLTYIPIYVIPSHGGLMVISCVSYPRLSLFSSVNIPPSSLSLTSSSTQLLKPETRESLVIPPCLSSSTSNWSLSPIISVS